MRVIARISRRGGLRPISGWAVIAYATVSANSWSFSGVIGGPCTGAASLSTTALAEMEKMTILRVFEQANGDKALAGKMLGISRATLYRKLKRYSIPLRGETAEGPAKEEQARGVGH